MVREEVDREARRQKRKTRWGDWGPEQSRDLPLLAYAQQVREPLTDVNSSHFYEIIRLMVLPKTNQYDVVRYLWYSWGNFCK